MPTCPHCDQSHDTGTDYCPRTGRPIADVADRMIGRTVAGKYKLTRCIGQGGMGTIFEAEHTLIGNKVAVKLLHEPFAVKREPVQRLYREAQATGAIGHPNIIKVHDVGETEEGVPFLVMELLDGESLGDHIERNGPRPLGFVLDVAIQMLSALNAAHKAGIIHRDLKSDNLFLLRTDDDALRIKILDFGISKITSPEADGLKLTQTGTLLGTPYYMSPEQASGKSDLDTRIDIYAAGVIIYETLLGVVPHRADNYNALLIEIITEDVAPFSYMRPDIPARLEAAVLKALSRSRHDRWATAVDLMEELVAIRREVPVSALHGAPVLGEKIEPVDRNSATLDISDVPAAHRGAVSQLAFETGGGTIQPPARARLAKAAGWVGGSVLLVGLIALAFLWLFDSEGEVAPPPEDDVAAPDGEGEPPNDVSTSVLLAVRATPHDAIVTADGERVTEAGIYVARGSSPIEVRVEAEGFEARALEVVPVTDLDLDIALDPLPEPEVDTSVEPDTGSVEVAAGKGGKGKGKGGKGGGKKPPKGPGTKPPDKAGDKPPKKPGDKPPKKPPRDQSLDRPMDNPF